LFSVFAAPVHCMADGAWRERWPFGKRNIRSPGFALAPPGRRCCTRQSPVPT
jgi:hypothetical protein